MKLITVGCHLNVIEVNPDTEQPEPGSGWWKTEYPDYIVQEHKELMAAISGTTNQEEHIESKKQNDS